MLRVLIIGALTFGIGASVFAQEEKSERYNKEMAKYSQTGEFKNCVRANSIRRTKILDDQHIIFEMTGKNILLNTLDRKCHSLGYLQQISYSVRNNRLCNVDFFNVMDNMRARTTCGFGKFEVLEKKEAG
ncbi:hypothetical protein [Pseudemcibacter aquimaris]|uniref:hypothetical protein n=1 Tax=Pseudemcibacter aquimaris TaxID=2857064 RepID=UPI002011CBCF|nr:hypothetical protein [Pseudemcibacter aquimaris]MCC3860479.1 hypothetical protein [Pseudemcibacter aquimaris]WDU59304.1 hypothetical protein KW060_03380 [Pseudemcibacter aquimaris]